ncbi:hypothetical protein V1290_002528 [Bradyrhizobium sp. AZCC 1578]|uniref:hypothetical protein n=1 Tax=Bradyrhizobium sp. AZCC 1578 TaxID=3117027 RepID=UPI002FF36F51
MKLSKASFWLVAAALMISTYRLAMSQDPGMDQYSNVAEVDRIKSIAKNILHLQPEPDATIGSNANVVGLRSKNILFSRRLDSRTYFVQDIRFGIGKPAGVFEGPDDELTNVVGAVFQGLDIPLSEVAEKHVLKESTQVGQVDRSTGRVVLEKETAGRRMVTASRQIEGIPIFDSRLLIGLTKNQQIGFMELHWPEIPKDTLFEARRLAYKVKEGWRPPQVEGARVESVEAGIVHSPAIALVMDIYPAIRVIYAPLESKFGKKPAVYYDRNGARVPVPRQFSEAAPEPPQKRSQLPDRK